MNRRIGIVVGGVLAVALVAALLTTRLGPHTTGVNAAAAVKGKPVAGAKAVVESSHSITARSATTTVTLPHASEDKPHRRPKPVTQNTNAPPVSRFTPLAPATGSAVRTPEAASAQTVASGFVGATFDDGGFVPPDTMGAIGPSQFLVAVNGRIRTFGRNGTADGALNTTLDNFFSSVGGVTNGTSDPRVRYDRISGRWFVTAIETPEGKANRIVLATSAGSTITPSSTWSFFIIPADANQFLDFDTLGVDEDALYIGANVFDAATEATFINTNAYVVRKTSVLGSGPIVFTKFANLVNTTTGAGLWSPVGVDNLDTGTNEGYFVGVDFAQLGKLDIRRISNPGGTPSISSNVTMTVPATQVPAPVPQPGGAVPLDAGDDRLSNAVVRNGRLWTSHNIELNSSGIAQTGGGRDGVRWYELQNLGGTPSVRQSGTTFDAAASNPLSYWTPSVAVSGQGHTALGFSQAGADSSGGFASAATTGRLSTDALGVLDAPSLLQSSTSSYHPTPDNPERWGDYSATSVDPTDDMTMWTIQEYASATDKWAVRVAELKAPPPTITSVTNALAGLSSIGVTVAGSGFFEPGAGFAKHLTAAATGGLSIGTISTVTPGQIKLAVSAVGVGPGDQTLTITNPDGQSVSATLSVVSPPPQTCIACTDYNGDVKSDIFWHNTKTGKIAVWFMDGTHFLSSAIPDPLSSAALDWVPFAGGDFNGDSKPDIAWHNAKTGLVAVWFMDGMHFVASALPEPKSSALVEWVPVATADFSADGKPDILWHNTRTGQVVVWTMDGTHYSSGVLTDPKSSAALEWTPSGAADFNGDGKADILWHNTRTGRVVVWFMDGTHFVSAAFTEPKSSASLEWVPVAAKDFGGDGKPDILWHNTRTGQVVVWTMDGMHYSSGVLTEPKSSASLEWIPF